MKGLRAATLGWLRLVMAPNRAFGLLSTCLTLAAAGALLYHHTFGARAAAVLADYSQSLQVFVGLVAVLVGIYGLLRGIGFHPALDYRYHEWLRAAPWAPGAPLPKGPLAPTWQDALVATAATLVCSIYAPQTAYPNVTVVGPTVALASGACLAWTAANYVTRNLVAVYGVLLVVPVTAIGCLAAELAAAPIALIAGAVVAHLGVRAGLAGYPWEVFPRDKNYLRRVTNPHGDRGLAWQQTAEVGWPYTQLLKPPKDYRVSLLRATIEAAIAAAWAALLGIGFSRNGADGAWILVGQFGAGLAIAKVITASAAVCPSMCLGTRIAKFRPLIWRHDRIFLDGAVVGISVAAVIAGWQWLSLGHHWVGCSLAAAVGVWMFRRVGRPLEERFFTGPQMVAGVAPQPTFFRRLAAPGD